jgi:hypothetical protein
MVTLKINHKEHKGESACRCEKTATALLIKQQLPDQQIGLHVPYYSSILCILCAHCGSISFHFH